MSAREPRNRCTYDQSHCTMLRLSLLCRAILLHLRCEKDNLRMKMHLVAQESVHIGNMYVIKVSGARRPRVGAGFGLASVEERDHLPGTIASCIGTQR